MNDVQGEIVKALGVSNEAMKSLFITKKTLLLAITLITSVVVHQEHNLFINFHYPTLTIILYTASLILTIVLTKIVFYRIAKEYMKSDSLSLSSSYLQVFIFLMLALLINIPLFFTDWPKIHVGFSGLFCGFFLLFMGGLITVWSMKIFGTWEKVIGSKTNKLDMAGFYRYSRNPQLVGYGIFLLGFNFLWPSVFAIISYLAYWYISYIMIKVEEAHLKKTFGNEYLHYYGNTPRLI